MQEDKSKKTLISLADDDTGRAQTHRCILDAAALSEKATIFYGFALP
jgi:hypothetical protein